MEQQTASPVGSPSVSSLMQSLQQALSLEAKFQPKLQLPSGPATGGVSFLFPFVYFILIFYWFLCGCLFLLGRWGNNLCYERWSCSCASLPQGLVRSPFFSSACISQFNGQVKFYQYFGKSMSYCNFFCCVFRFISHMKARPKHLSCIAISSFHLAAFQWVERVKLNSNDPSTLSTLQVQ